MKKKDERMKEERMKGIISVVQPQNNNLQRTSFMMMTNEKKVKVEVKMYLTKKRIDQQKLTWFDALFV